MLQDVDDIIRLDANVIIAFHKCTSHNEGSKCSNRT